MNSPYNCAANVLLRAITIFIPQEQMFLFHFILCTVSCQLFFLIFSSVLLIQQLNLSVSNIFTQTQKNRHLMPVSCLYQFLLSYSCLTISFNFFRLLCSGTRSQNSQIHLSYCSSSTSAKSQSTILQVSSYKRFSF